MDDVDDERIISGRIVQREASVGDGPRKAIEVQETSTVFLAKLGRGPLRRGKSGLVPHGLVQALSGRDQDHELNGAPNPSSSNPSPDAPFKPKLKEDGRKALSNALSESSREAPTAHGAARVRRILSRSVLVPDYANPVPILTQRRRSTRAKPLRSPTLSWLEPRSSSGSYGRHPGINLTRHAYHSPTNQGPKGERRHARHRRARASEWLTPPPSALALQAPRFPLLVVGMKREGMRVPRRFVSDGKLQLERGQYIASATLRSHNLGGFPCR